MAYAYAAIQTFFRNLVKVANEITGRVGIEFVATNVIYPLKDFIIYMDLSQNCIIFFGYEKIS